MASTVLICYDLPQKSGCLFPLQVRIPDDQSSRSQFAIIDDELEEQLRAILESNETEDESKVFKMARDQYNACMDLDQVISLAFILLLGPLLMFVEKIDDFINYL